MTLRDCQGAPFEGTPEELKRHNAKLRKRASRANAEPELRLPLPAGTAAALAEVVEAAGFDDPRDFLAFQIHRLHMLLWGDRHTFEAQARRTVTVSGLDKYLPLIGGDVPEGEELTT